MGRVVRLVIGPARFDVELTEPNREDAEELLGGIASMLADACDESAAVRTNGSFVLLDGDEDTVATITPVEA